MSPDWAEMGHELDAAVPAELALLDELLRILSEALDDPEVLPRVSAIVKRVDEQLAKAAHRLAETQARAERLELRVRSLERAATLREGRQLAGVPLPLQSTVTANSSDVTTTDLPTLERQTIVSVMSEVKGNKTKAARRLGLTRTQLYGRLKKYRLV